MNKLSTIISLLGLSLFSPLWGCSDDTEAAKDSGTPADQAQVTFKDQSSAADQGPAADQAIPLKVEEYVPADNAIGDWVEDTSVGSPGVEAGYTDEDIMALRINGEHAPYATEGCSGFAMQDFINGNGDTLSLKIWDMNSAAGAENMYDVDVQKGVDEEGLTFEEIPGVSEEGVLATVGAYWKAYFHKSTYIAKIYAKVASGGDKEALKALVITFIQQLSASLP